MFEKQEKKSMIRKHVISFAGTTEGRILANWLDDQPGITGVVCVATEYGAEVLTEESWLKHLKVHCGRLNEKEIEMFLEKEKPSLVIDATHPYAREITANIRKACEKYREISYLRCLRESSEERAETGMIHVKDMKEAVQYLSETKGNIFLTTEEMNYVQLKEFQCSYLVTKDGGDTGGFKEKIQAAKRAGVICVVIDRPEEKGLSLVQIEEAVKEWMEHGSE